MLEEILKKYNLKFDDLSEGERQTLFSWIGALQETALSIEKIREYVRAMKDSVEMELTKIGHESKQDIFLKARLRNYMMLEAFLSSPEKAKQSIERAIAGIAGNKG